jgi:hypothetical protein
MWRMLWVGAHVRKVEEEIPFDVVRPGLYIDGPAHSLSLTHTCRSQPRTHPHMRVFMYLIS